MVFISVSKMVLVDFATLTARAEGSFSQLHWKIIGASASSEIVPNYGLDWINYIIV